MDSILKKKEFLISLFSFILLNLIVLFLWNRSIKEQKLALEHQVNNSGKLLTTKFSSIINRDIQRLENLKQRLQITDGEYFNYWEHDAQIILEQNPSFKFLEWIDSSMVIRKINPLKGNEAVIGLDISTVEYRRDEWIRHIKDSSTNITQWADLKQGGKSFLVDVPVYFKNRFQGTITAGMDFKKNLDSFAVGLPDYGIVMRDEKGSIFYTHNSVLSDSLDFVYTHKFSIDELDQQNWSMKITPASSTFLMDKSKAISNMLYFGVLISSLLSLIIYFYLRAKTESALVLKVNEDLKIINKKLDKARSKAEKASKAKTEFLSNMSHEIRTPLNAILGFIEVLKHSKNKDADKTFLDLMDKSSQTLMGLVDDVLEIDKIEAGEIKIKKVPFSPSQELAEIIKDFSFEFEEKNIVLDLDFVSNSGTTVLGDKERYSQILIHLLKNALKFTSTGGAYVSYQESFTSERLNVSISIKDTGIGIPKHRLTKIFKRFTQADYGLKKKHEGSGLGLTICDKLAKLMGGQISVKSEVNKGSVFTIEIPFQVLDDNKSKKLDLAPVIKESLNVLIVDDNKVNILVLAKILEQLGIKTEQAENGIVALDKMKQKQFQVVIMDIHMPLMNGFETTKAIRNTDKDILIFGLSANITQQAKDESLLVGMNDYLCKPLSKEKLQSTLSKYFSLK